MKIFKGKSILISLLSLLFFMGCQNDETDIQAQSTKSNDKAKIVLVEYSDFQCPTCALFYPIVEKLKDHYGDQLEIKYRYFPLNSHRYSLLAARAAESARKQKKFEQMERLLFTNQKDWASSSNPQAIFIDYAKQIGLNMQEFKDDLNAAQTQKTVMQQKKEGRERGVTGTPTFIINGEKMVQLPRNYAEFKALLDIYLKEAKQKASS